MFGVVVVLGPDSYLWRCLFVGEGWGAILGGRYMERGEGGREKDDAWISDPESDISETQTATAVTNLRRAVGVSEGGVGQEVWRIVPEGRWGGAERGRPEALAIR